MSIAGGYYKAVQIAHRCGCECVQVFTKNNNQWRAKVITEGDVLKFQTELTKLKITHPIAHNSYLINMASPDEVLWSKSVDAMVVELSRAAQLGIPYVVAHPGAFTSSSEAAGLKRIIQALDEASRQTRGLSTCCLLETTAGQGTNLGWRFEHLTTILNGVQDPARLGICLDTCHVFAAGYAVSTQKEYRVTMRALHRAVGIENIKAVHLNDSKTKFGSRVDRHARIGQGEMGLDPFRYLLNDPRLREVPMYLETPKGQEDGQDLDMINLNTLRALIVQ